MLRKEKYLAFGFFLLLIGCSGNQNEIINTQPVSETTSTTSTTSTTTTIDLDNIDGVEYLTITSRSHTEEDLDYPTTPPAGGDHLGIWHNCGKYLVELLDEAAVHTLEHGVIWITYLPDIAPREIEKLDELLKGNQRFLMSPYTDQPAPIVLTSWGRRLEIENADDPRILAFIEAFTDSPSSPEPGATCNGGIGIPPGDAFTPNTNSGVQHGDDGSIEIGIRSQSISTTGSEST